MSWTISEYGGLTCVTSTVQPVAMRPGLEAAVHLGLELAQLVAVSGCGCTTWPTV